jgi:hypothetical protein
MNKTLAVAAFLAVLGLATTLAADAAQIGGTQINGGTTWLTGTVGSLLPWGILAIAAAAFLFGEHLMQFVGKLGSFVVYGVVAIFAVAIIGTMGLNAAGATLH